MKKLLCIIISSIMAMSMLTGCAGGEVEQEEYQQAVFEAGKLNDRQYIVPMTYDAPIMYTSKKAMDSVSINPDNCKDYFGFLNELESENKKDTFLFISKNEIKDYYLYGDLGLWDTKNQTAELDGNLANDSEEQNDWMYLEAGAKMSAMTQENYDKLSSFIFEEIDSCTQETDASDIITENMQPYFDDEKSYEECVQKAQKQLEIYVSE